MSWFDTGLLAGCLVAWVVATGCVSSQDIEGLQTQLRGELIQP